MTREDLKGYYNTQKWVNEQLERYKEQLELIEDIRTTNYDGMPKAKGKPNYAIEELLDSINQMVNILNEEQKKLNKIMQQLLLMKDEPKPYRSLLTYLYIDGYSLEKASDKIGYSYNKASTMTGIALNEFDKLHIRVTLGKTS